MTMPELAEWLESRDHQVTITLRKESGGLYIKMIDMNTGQIQMGLLGSDLIGSFNVMILDDMYAKLMESLGREERNA